jgi:hypothetical protein
LSPTASLEVLYYNKLGFIASLGALHSRRNALSVLWIRNIYVLDSI